MGTSGAPIAASRGSVTSFPGHRCGGVILSRRNGSALAGDGDVFVAADVLAAIAGPRNDAGNFVGVDAPIGRGLGKIPRLAIEPGRMGAAFIAAGEALVDAVPVRLVGDDEHAAVRRRRRSGSYENTSQDCGETSHDAPGNKGSPAFDKQESLKMINLAERAAWCPKTGFSEALTQSPRLAHGSRDERFPRHLWHLPRDYELAIRWLRPSFLKPRSLDARPQGTGYPWICASTIR